MAKGQPSILINPRSGKASTGLASSYLLQALQKPPPISVCKILVLLQIFSVLMCSVCLCPHVCGYMHTVVHTHARLCLLQSHYTLQTEMRSHLTWLTNLLLGSLTSTIHALWTLNFQRAVTSTWLFWGLGDCFMHEDMPPALTSEI